MKEVFQKTGTSRTFSKNVAISGPGVEYGVAKDGWSVRKHMENDPVVGRKIIR